MIETRLIFLAFSAGVFTTILNAAGASPIFFMKRISQRSLDLGLGFASGVMIAASFTSLIVPGIEGFGVIPVMVGIVLGSITVGLADKIVPHMHRIIGLEGRPSERLRAIWLFVIAVTLHNLPEGLAVGVGFGAGNLDKAISLAVAIGIQNLPEGTSIAFSTLGIEEISKSRAFLISFLSGAVELPLAVIGAVAVMFMSPILPYAMGFAAGAMLFVISDEMIPETHRLGHERLVTYGLIAGLIVMLLLDTLL